MHIALEPVRRIAPSRPLILTALSLPPTLFGPLKRPLPGIPYHPSKDPAGGDFALKGPRRPDLVVLILLGAAVVYAALFLDRGWIPHDDGTLGETALRVLGGQLPHRDFSDVYTGGLAYWNALSFMLFGVNLLAPRILLFLSFLGFLGASYAIARRFAGARTSAAVVLCMTVWGMPNYPAAMPSWYNLFLAVAAVWGLARYLESTRIRWLVFAGACAGVSILMKVIGLYTLAGLLLAVAFFEQNTAGTANDSSRPLREGLRWYSVVLTSAAVVLVLMIVRLIASDFTWPSAVHFVLPTSLIAGLLIYFEWRQPHVLPSGERLERVLRTAGPVIAGALGPVLLFVMLYLASGALGDLIQGVFVSPLRRLSESTLSPPALGQTLPSLGLLVILALAAAARGAARGAFLAGAVILFVVILAIGGNQAVFQAVWSGYVIAIPVCVAAGVLVLSAARSGDGPSSSKGTLRPDLQPVLAAALLAQAALFGLVQFPFAGAIYALYVGSLIPLVVLALVAVGGKKAHLPGTVLLVFALAFGVRWLGTGNMVTVGFGGYETRRDTERLRMDRGGIRVTPEERDEFELLVATLQQLAPGEATLAFPDAPEVYFLSGLRNPTGVLFDFFAEDEGRVERLLSTLDEHDVSVVVIKLNPSFSGRPPPALMEELEARYPIAVEIGHYLVVRRP